MFGLLHSQTVTIEPHSAEAATGWQGAGTFGTAVTYACRIEWKQSRVVDAQGEARLSQGRVIIAGIQSVGVRDRLTLPSGHTPLTPPILAVEKSPDPFGVAASTVVYF